MPQSLLTAAGVVGFASSEVCWETGFVQNSERSLDERKDYGVLTAVVRIVGDWRGDLREPGGDVRVRG